MDRTSKLVLLPTLLLILSLTNFVQCGLYGEQLRQYFNNLYAAPYEEHAVNRRNIPTLSGSGVFQEPSSRDLDVGVAIGVKDEGEAKDILINNHSSKTYSPAEVSSSPYEVQEPPSSKELNIGVYVDPKNGVRYFTPGSVPNNPRQYFYEDLSPKPIVNQVVPGQIYPTFLTNQPVTTPISYQPAFSQYPLISSNQAYGQQRYLGSPPLINESPYPYQANPYFTALPAPDQNYPLNRILNQDRFQQISYPNQNYYQQPLETDPYIVRPYQSKQAYPNQNYYQQPLEVDPYIGRPYQSKQFTIPETVYRPPITANVFDDGYQGRFRRHHGRFPYVTPEFKYRTPMKNFQNVFNIQEQFPTGSYGHITEPVVMRQEPQLSEIIVDQRGTPVMTSQPYGERQVGAFKLKNDHGYQVTMNVPSIPADGPSDGVLVMEMKANLYRPLN